MGVIHLWNISKWPRWQPIPLRSHIYFFFISDPHSIVSYYNLNNKIVCACAILQSFKTINKICFYKIKSVDLMFNKFVLIIRRFLV